MTEPRENTGCSADTDAGSATGAPSVQRRFGWSLHGDGRHVRPGAVVAPDERLSWPRTIGIGMQHVIAMFGSTLLVPTITGFPIQLFTTCSGTINTCSNSTRAK